MYSQKRVKTQAHEASQWGRKQVPQPGQKKSMKRAHHKQSEALLKSLSKDITPKKHSIIVQHSKFKDHGANQKQQKSKYLTSVCSYSILEKQSLPTTKRKASNARSNQNMVKKASKSKNHLNPTLKNTVQNFSVLTKCLTEFIKEQRKHGNDPSSQILQLIKAFNRSQVAPLSKDLEKLISSILNYIEDSVDLAPQRNPSLKERIIISRSSFSSASDRQIAYSQVLENSQIPSTVKKQQSNNQLKNKKENIKNNVQKCAENTTKNRQDGIDPIFQRSGSKLNKQLEVELKNDLQKMKNQLSQLRNAGQKLQLTKEAKGDDRKNLQEMYLKNKMILESISNDRTRSVYEQQKSDEQDEDVSY